MRYKVVVQVVHDGHKVEFVFGIVKVFRLLVLLPKLLGRLCKRMILKYIQNLIW